MHVDVLLFGPLAQRAGMSHIPLDVDSNPVTVTHVREELVRAKPELASVLSGCRLSINHEFASEDASIQSEDEVAVIGFVSGG